MKRQWSFRFKNSPTARLWSCLGLAALGLAAGLNVARAAVFDVDLTNERFSLYTDPYNGNVVKLGGFSGMVAAPGQPNTFYIITDRGAKPGFVNSSGTSFDVFLRPDFGPHIVKAHLQPDGRALISDVRPLRYWRGQQATGLPNPIPVSGLGFDVNLNLIGDGLDDDGIDAEGITLDPWGNFWICEEYRPSIVVATRGGYVLLRLVPQGTLTGAEKIRTFDVLPGILTKRRNNRGLEGIAATSDGMLYAVMQRPLNNPSQTVGNASRNARILAINLRALFHPCGEPAIRQLLYRTEANASPANVLLSDIFSLTPSTFLVSERRTDKLFSIDVTGATDITPFENPDGTLVSDPTKTLEMLDDVALAALGITTVAKTVVLPSLTAIDPLLATCEGVCVSGGNIVLTHDNDFGILDAVAPANPNPNGPFVEIPLSGNPAKIFTVPLQ